MENGPNSVVGSHTQNFGREFFHGTKQDGQPDELNSQCSQKGTPRAKPSNTPTGTHPSCGHLLLSSQKAPAIKSTATRDKMMRNPHKNTTPITGFQRRQTLKIHIVKLKQHPAHPAAHHTHPPNQPPPTLPQSIHQKIAP